MSASTGGYPPPTAGPPAGSRSTSDAARDEAAAVAESAKQAGGQVAQSATEQAKDVATEASRQARNLLNEGRDQVREQARTGQQKAAEKLESVADELHTMAAKSDESGVAAEMAMQASEKVRDVASWLQNREPGDLLVEVRNWARRRPGAFLAGAAVAGVLAGRLTRGAMAAQSEQSGQDGQGSSGSGNGAAQLPVPYQASTPRAPAPTPAGYAEPSPSYAPPQPDYAPPQPGYASPGYAPPPAEAVPPPPPAYRTGGAPNQPALGYGPGGRVQP